MSNLYFQKHQTTEYNGIKLKNLMRRSQIVNKVFNNAANFYPYIIEEGERIEHVAYNYYGDPNLSWLILMSNDMTDPYYDWYLSTRQFERFIKSKYGSIADAQATVVHYKHRTKNYIVSTDTIEQVDPATGLTYGGESVGDFDAIDAYTYEQELNEEKKFITLLDESLVPVVTEELRLLNG